MLPRQQPFAVGLDDAAQGLLQPGADEGEEQPLPGPARRQGVEQVGRQPRHRPRPGGQGLGQRQVKLQGGQESSLPQAPQQPVALFASAAGGSWRRR